MRGTRARTYLNLGRGEESGRQGRAGGEREEENSSRARAVYFDALYVCWEALARGLMILCSMPIYAIQMGLELGILKIELDEAQERFDICQNQWQQIKNACDDIKKRKAHLRVFGKK